MTRPQPLCLGLIGGLGPGATIEYYRALLKAHAERQIPLRLLIAHADMNYVVRQVRDGARAALAGYFAGLIGQLAAAGAHVAAVSAITPHMCADELTAISPLPVVDPIHETAREIRARGVQRVALLGTRYIMETGLFGRLSDFDPTLPGLTTRCAPRSRMNGKWVCPTRRMSAFTALPWPTVLVPPVHI